MPEAEREHMLATALADDDEVLIGAVIEQPAPISGISKARQRDAVLHVEPEQRSNRKRAEASERVVTEALKSVNSRQSGFPARFPPAARRGHFCEPWEMPANWARVVWFA